MEAGFSKISCSLSFFKVSYGMKKAANRQVMWL